MARATPVIIPVTRHDDAPRPCGMLINIVVAAVAADPAVALEPRDHLVPVGFRLPHGHPRIRKYMRIMINTSQYEVRNYLRNLHAEKFASLALRRLLLQPQAESSACVIIQKENLRLFEGGLNAHQGRDEPPNGIVTFQQVNWLRFVKSGLPCGRLFGQFFCRC